MEMTIEQQRAMAMARARARAEATTPAPASDPLQRSYIIPMARNTATGQNEWALPKVITGIPDLAKGIYEGIAGGVMAPGDALNGNLEVMGPDGHVTPEAIGRSADLAGLISPINPAVRAGEKVIAGAGNTFKKPHVDPPSAESLKEAADNGYKAAREMGVEYSSQSVADMAKRTGAALEADGFSDVTAPKTFATLQRLSEPPPNSVATLSNVDAARRSFNKIGQDFANPTDRAAGKRVRGELDEFLMGPPEGAVVSGQADEAARTIANARGNLAASKRSDSLLRIQDAAELRAAASNSGANTANAIRQRIAALVENPKRLSGFNDVERALIEKIARGDGPTNLTRAAGNYLGGGGGLGAAASTALAGGGAVLATGNPAMGAVGLAAPVVGAASKAVSEYLTKKALSKADSVVRMRSPLYEQMLKDAPTAAQLPRGVEAVIRALILSQGQSRN
jgi:hypothetical protein